VFKNNFIYGNGTIAKSPFMLERWEFYRAGLTKIKLISTQTNAVISDIKIGKRLRLCLYMWIPVLLTVVHPNAYL
jgi:hypothetical protein